MELSNAISGIGYLNSNPAPAPDVVQAISLMAAAKSAAPTDRTSKPRKLNRDELVQFANFVPSGNVKEIADELQRRGLKNADQMVNEIATMDTSSKENIGRSQSAWKAGAFVNALMKAREAGISSEAEFMANKDFILSGLDSRYKSAIKDKTFEQIHPDWWQKLSQVYFERLKNEQPANSNVAAAF